MTNIEGRLRRLETAQPEQGVEIWEQIIADPRTDPWAATDEGIAAEIARQRAAGILRSDSSIIVRRIVDPVERA